MFTWISSPFLSMAALYGAALIVTMSPSGAATMRDPDSPASHGETALPVLDDQIVVHAPSGYCVDRLASVSDRRAAFVLMASCRSLTGNGAAATPAVPGLLTASVDAGSGALPEMSELSRYFATERGRAALSHSGNGAATTLEAIYSQGTVLYLNATESDAVPALAGHSWRAVFEVNGQLVTATLRDFAETPIAPEDGFRTLRQFVEALQSANAGGASALDMGKNQRPHLHD